MTIECYYDDYFKIINSYSPKMFDNDQYIEELVKKRGAKFFDFASERLCTDIEFIKKMVEINYPDVDIQHVPVQDESYSIASRCTTAFQKCGHRRGYVKMVTRYFRPTQPQVRK